MSAATAPARPSINPVLRIGTRLFNPLMLRFAGTRWLPSYGVLAHVGRGSSRSFRTPWYCGRMMGSSYHCRGASEPTGVAMCALPAGVLSAGKVVTISSWSQRSSTRPLWPGASCWFSPGHTPSPRSCLPSLWPSERASSSCSPSTSRGGGTSSAVRQLVEPHQIGGIPETPPEAVASRAALRRFELLGRPSRFICAFPWMSLPPLINSQTQSSRPARPCLINRVCVRLVKTELSASAVSNSLGSRGRPVLASVAPHWCSRLAIDLASTRRMTEVSARSIRSALAVPLGGCVVASVSRRKRCCLRRAWMRQRKSDPRCGQACPAALSIAKSAEAANTGATAGPEAPLAVSSQIEALPLSPVWLACSGQRTCSRPRWCCGKHGGVGRQDV
jgi:hypothetical protein